MVRPNEPTPRTRMYALDFFVALAVWSASSPPAHESAPMRQRCGTPPRPHDLAALMPPSDCGYFTTSIQPQYDPSFSYYIPVVFHVIQHTNGNGFLSAATIRDQIRVLNEDFLALAGTPGAPGINAKIRFRLAELDPNGNPTTGITYSTNNTWYNDGGAYWNSLAWDTNRYLNVYTNNPGGFFGYVPDWPQGGIVGSNSDRVVVWWQAVGKLPTAGWPLNMGRTLTHEVGHYFGLEHPFYGGCASASNCYANGDLICDTPPQTTETLGCPSSPMSCGNPSSMHNYMDYTDDPCLWEFTPEQVNRMRCTIEHWRPDLSRQPELAERLR